MSSHLADLAAGRDEPVPDAGPDRLLILSASFGQGHLATARALQSAADANPGLNLTVDIVDFAEEANRQLNAALKYLFEIAAKHVPSAYRWVYRATDRRNAVIRFFNRLAYRINGAHVKQILRDHDPAMVIVNYPIWQQLACRSTKEALDRVEYVTLLTDSTAVHSAWANPGTDLYLIPDESTAKGLHGLGVAARRTFPLGYPVHPRFALPVDTCALSAAGLEEGERFVLISASWFRPRDVLSLIRALGEVIPHMALVVATGMDDDLHHALQHRSRNLAPRVRIIGWTDVMPEFIKASQLVITKAGGSTVMECIAAAKPMVINKIIPGQEEGNAELVEGLGFGKVALDPRAAAEAAAAIISDMPAYTKRLDGYGNPAAAHDILMFLRQRLDRVRMTADSPT
jgi:processive 1,2-diacylglycerol beta-glucosyltransferase